MSTPIYDPLADPTLFDYDKSAISAPGVRPRWVYVPASVYNPARLDACDIKGMTIFYGGTATEERKSTMLAVLHPTDPENASRVGWGFSDTLQMTGPDASQIIVRARGKRCWWIVVSESAVLQGLIDLASTRDGQHEEQRLQVSLARSGHASDIEKIGIALQEEAESRGWCSEYDEFVEGLNGGLTYDLPVREREYEVEIEATYRMTVTVTARSEDEAMETADDHAIVDHDDANAWTLSEVDVVEATVRE